MLAQAAETTEQATEARPDAIIPVDAIWEQITSLGLPAALTFISFGVVCIMYGWRVFKVLVVISFALIGLVLGVAASQRIKGENHEVLCGIIGLVLLTILSLPLMRWAVSLLGAAAGGVLAAGAYYASTLPERYVILGALVGVVAGGMISFIVFKVAIMLFSSLGGGALMVIGTFALLHHYPPTTEAMRQVFFGTKWFLPVCLFIPTAIGIIIQNKMIKGSKDWSV